MSVRPPDVPAVLSRLKGFQRDTVAHAFHRLYEAPDSSHRFLVADEVGLGKTLVARGVVAKTIEHLWPDIDRIDVIYICSNHSIAQQNVRRLSLFPDDATHSLDRLTLLPTAVNKLNERKVNFVAFTPGTSFNLRSSAGTARERIVLYWLMQRVWPRDGVAPMNLFQGGVTKWRSFRERIRWFDDSPDTQLDDELARRFGERLRQRADEDRAAGRPTLEERYDELLGRFTRARSTPHPTHRSEQFQFIGELRLLLARTCVQALEPDLVILDEFQRFKELLDGDDEAAQLAKQLFEYSDADTDVRILLLSATPYKMYTLHHESHEDDHYTDFLRTVEFLGGDESRHRRFEHQLGEHRRELYRLADGGDTDRLRSLKEGIEGHLRRLMSRTERVRSTEQGDGMLTEVRPLHVPLEAGDVRAFQGLAKVAAEVDQPGVIEYWKSAPYLLSFMDDYKLKSEFEETLEVDGHDLQRLLHEYPELQLPWDAIEDYDAIDPQNHRLRALLHWLDETDAWRLLWLPPTLPYHRLGSSFRNAQTADLTKRLLFSSWAVVPKAIASMLSYEVERRIFPAHDPETRNTAEERKRRRPLLTLTFSQGRLTGMPVLGLLYPSPTLAERTDPLELGRARNPEASAGTVLGAARERLEPLVDELVAEHAHPESAREDETWYWAAPILLDKTHRPESLAWLESRSVAAEWSGGEDDGDEESRWAEHVDRARQLIHGEIDLGPPPDDLLDTLALLGIAGPANTALRALTRDGLGAAPLDSPKVRTAAGRLGWGFRSLFNQPEAMALLRIDQSDEPYWKLTLQYSARGCLQAVLDEHTHLVRDLGGWIDSTPEETATGVADDVHAALTLRTSNAYVDEITDGNGENPTLRRRTLRNHFALRFGAQTTDDGSSLVREGAVRTAFNSPFWPFVLATTSRGQEGLDFHAYAHAVVHWNLPANPVDLEQREGRVHRYKGHALRRNVAERHGPAAFDRPDNDIWERLFELAAVGGGNGGRELSPYWVFPGRHAIERHVPRLPLSRDAYQLDALRRSLAVYRLVFGQPRQDDLMAYLLDRVGPDRLEELAPLLRIDLAPQASSATGVQGREFLRD